MKLQEAIDKANDRLDNQRHWKETYHVKTDDHGEVWFTIYSEDREATLYSSIPDEPIFELDEAN